MSPKYEPSSERQTLDPEPYPPNLNPVAANMDTTGTFDMAKVRNLKPLNPDPQILKLDPRPNPSSP